MESQEEQQQQAPGQAKAPPKHVPLRQITYQALLRSLGAEHDALQKIHVRIQQQLRNLEVEEKLIMQMIHRERHLHSAEELEAFDKGQQHQQQAEQHLQQQQEQQQHQPNHEDADLQHTQLPRGQSQLDGNTAQQQEAELQQQQQQQQGPEQHHQDTSQLHLEAIEGVEREEF